MIMTLLSIVSSFVRTPPQAAGTVVWLVSLLRVAGSARATRRWRRSGSAQRQRFATAARIVMPLMPPATSPIFQLSSCPTRVSSCPTRVSSCPMRRPRWRASSLSSSVVVLTSAIVVSRLSKRVLVKGREAVEAFHHGSVPRFAFPAQLLRAFVHLGHQLGPQRIEFRNHANPSRARVLSLRQPPRPRCPVLPPAAPSARACQ